MRGTPKPPVLPQCGAGFGSCPPTHSPSQGLLPFIPQTIFLAEFKIPPQSFLPLPPPLPSLSPHPWLRDPSARPARRNPSTGSGGSSGASSGKIKNETYL